MAVLLNPADLSGFLRVCNALNADPAKTFAIQLNPECILTFDKEPGGVICVIPANVASLALPSAVPAPAAPEVTPADLEEQTTTGQVVPTPEPDNSEPATQQA
jgi:hypothetical protein